MVLTENTMRDNFSRNISNEHEEKKNMEIPPFDETMNLGTYLKEQMKEALGELNMYYAGKELGHKPSLEEAWDYYSSHGGRADFRRRNLCHRAGISEDIKKSFYSGNLNISHLD